MEYYRKQSDYTETQHQLEVYIRVEEAWQEYAEARKHLEDELRRKEDNRELIEMLGESHPETGTHGFNLDNFGGLVDTAVDADLLMRLRSMGALVTEDEEVDQRIGSLIEQLKNTRAISEAWQRLQVARFRVSVVGLIQDDKPFKGEELTFEGLKPLDRYFQLLEKIQWQRETEPINQTKLGTFYLAHLAKLDYKFVKKNVVDRDFADMVIRQLANMPMADLEKLHSRLLSKGFLPYEVIDEYMEYLYDVRAGMEPFDWPDGSYNQEDGFHPDNYC